MYMNDAVNEVGLADARRTLADLVHETAVRGRITYLTNRGRRIAAIVPIDIAENATPASIRDPQTSRPEVTEPTSWTVLPVTLAEQPTNPDPTTKEN